MPFLKDLQDSFTKALGGLPPALLQFHANESVPVLLQPLGKQSHPRSCSALYESIITVLAEDFSAGYSSSVPFAAVPRRRSQHVPGNSSSEPALQIPALGDRGAPEPPLERLPAVGFELSQAAQGHPPKGKQTVVVRGDTRVPLNFPVCHSSSARHGFTSKLTPSNLTEEGAGLAVLGLLSPFSLWRSRAPTATSRCSPGNSTPKPQGRAV